jgi:predicted PurR-regulated permease PerM
MMGFLGALGALVAYWLATRIDAISGVLILIVVSMFVAVGINPTVEWLQRKGLKRHWAVLAVISMVIAVLTIFVVTIVPVASDQISKIVKNAPLWLDQLSNNRWLQGIDSRFDVIDKVKAYLAESDLGGQLFGGVLGAAGALVGFLADTLIVAILTLYFLANMPTIKQAMWKLAPASRRERVSLLGERILDGIGGYVSGAFIVALFAGVTTLVFLLAVGLGEYAVALALVVAFLDVIPMVGATLGALIVIGIAFATDTKTGIIAVIFYVIYQQLENYVIYPRVMSKSVDVPGVVIVIAAVVGATLLGVIGALLAIPTAAAILLIMREVVIRRLDAT